MMALVIFLMFLLQETKEKQNKRLLQFNKNKHNPLPQFRMSKLIMIKKDFNIGNQKLIKLKTKLPS